ncbi:MAG: SigB/SigF/SigG family RNA polymerase sigma factor [Limnochordia bacterium]
MQYLTSTELPAVNLSSEQTRRLLSAAQGGDTQAREMLIHANMRLARSITRRFTGRCTDPEDLFQVACLGLMKAIDNFDLSFDVRFSTYAVPCIIGEIRRYLQQDRPVRLGRSLQERVGAVSQARERLTHELGRSPTTNEIACWLNIEREEVITALEAASTPASLEEVIHESEGEPILLQDQIGAEETDSLVFIDNLALQQVLNVLSEEERSLVTMRFFQNMRQVDVAKALRLSQPQVSRLEQRILRKMRAMLVS